MLERELKKKNSSPTPPAAAANFERTRTLGGSGLTNAFRIPDGPTTAQPAARPTQEHHEHRFIATAPAAPEEGEINSSAFWPAISLSDLRETARLDGTVTTARLTHAVIDAITSVNRDLADWRTARQAEGHTTLADVPSEAHQQRIGAPAQLPARRLCHDPRQPAGTLHRLQRHR